jgi:hypothetical protein
MTAANVTMTVLLLPTSEEDLRAWTKRMRAKETETPSAD